jgi:peptide/nickel transport system ATP-binding protein
METPAKENLLEVKGLSLAFGPKDKPLFAVENLDLSLGAGEILGVVGESGCGKTLSALAVIGLLPPGCRIEAGSIRFLGQELSGLRGDGMRGLRGREIAMIFQEPATALNPVQTIGAQIVEPLLLHTAMTMKEARAEALSIMTKVGFAGVERLYGVYPHQLSGGMRQRAMIAMAIACKPRLIIADEPTTALDATIQAQILELLVRINRDYGMAILLISHDLGVVGGLCGRVAVMYAGSVVEEASTTELFRDPVHPYTKGLIASRPTKESKGRPLYSIPGAVPRLGHKPSGCPFMPRCGSAVPSCALERPDSLEVGPGHEARCPPEAEKRRRVDE